MSVSMLRSPQNQIGFDIEKIGFSFHQELDLNKIKLHYQNDLHFCLQMFEVCLHTVPIEVANMKDAGEQKDYLALATISAKLKSNFDLVGHKEMSAILGCIELYAKMKNPTVLDLCFVFTSKVNGKLAIIRNEVLKISHHLKQQKKSHIH